MNIKGLHSGYEAYCQGDEKKARSHIKHAIKGRRKDRDNCNTTGRIEFARLFKLLSNNSR